MLRSSEKATFQVSEAQSLETGSDLLRNDDFDVVLLDLDLPEVSGVELVKRIKARMLEPVPLVVLTGRSDDGLGVEAVRHGAQDFLPKQGLQEQLLERTLRYAVERHSITRSLIGSEHRLRVLFEYAPDAYYLSDLEGNFVDGNLAAEEMTGFDRQELIGRNLFLLKLLRGPDLQKAIQALARNSSGLPTGPEEYKLHRKDGTEIAVEVRTYPVSVHGKALVLGIARDISERKRLEAQLRQVQKMEAIGQLAGGVAHDFNNLLVVMRGNAELMMLDEDKLPASAKECLNQITEAAERASNLTRQLLTFSRKQVMQSRPLELNEVLGNMTKMLTRLIGENIRLQCRYAPGLPRVQADAGMLEQVIVNLVVNARDAMPNGGQLEVGTDLATLDEAQARTNPEGRPGVFVCITVRDNGIGISPEDLQHIFEPFFTTKDAGRGTGLGLATVYGIVKQHQGWIDVVSEAGSGTTFKIYLPVSTVQTSRESRAKPEVPPRGGDESILLVEDDLPVRQTTRKVLESFGYQVLEAKSPIEGIKAYKHQAEEISLLLTDVVMPEGNGSELAQMLRQMKPDLKVILMSGYSPDRAVQDPAFLRKHDFRFLQKPCASRQLLETVRQCLDEKEVIRA